MVTTDAKQSQINFLLALSAKEPTLQVCSVCHFPKDLHDEEHHEFAGWPIFIIIEHLRAE
jgi:hypothetical protein